MKNRTTTTDEELVTDAAEPQFSMEELATKLREKFIEAAMTQANAADPQQLVNAIVKDLNAAKNEVTLKLIGMNNTWGKWELDGRANGNLINEMINDDARTLVHNWVQEAVKEVFTEEAKSAFLERVKKDLKKYIKQNLLDGYNVRKVGGTICEELLHSAANELRAELALPPAPKNTSRY